MEMQEPMDISSSHASGHCQKCQPALPNAASGAKKLLDSAEPVQAPQLPKKTCVLSQPYSIPDPSGKLLLCSPGSACFEGSSHFLDDSGCHDPADSSSAANCYGDVAISLNASGCFDDSEPDDSLLELSDSEVVNSPFDYAEEDIQKILADDYMESEQDPTGTSTLSQSGSGESEKDEGSSCTEASVTSEDVSIASETVEKPDEALSRESSFLCSECYPNLLSDSTGAEENQPQSTPVTGMLFDLDIRELLLLSPIDADCEDEPLEDSCWEETEGVASEVIRSNCPEFDNTASSCVLEETSEGLVSEGQQSLGADCLGKTQPASKDVSSSCGAHVLSDTGAGQGETTTGKKPGEVIPVPQEERLTQRLEQQKHFYPERVCPHEDDCGSYVG